MNIFSGSYSTDFITTVGFSMRIGGIDQVNSEKTIVKPEVEFDSK